MTSLENKLHLRSGMSMCVLDAPAGYQLRLADFRVVVQQVKKLAGALDVIQVFVTRKAQLDKRLAPIKAVMGERSALWVCYPKAGVLGTDLNRDLLRAALADHGLQAVSQIAIDDVWSGLRFKRTDTPPPATKRTFSTQLVNDGGVEVPFDVEAVFGRKRVPIVATVNGVSYRTTVMVYGGRYFFPMRRDIRDRAGVAANGRVQMTIEPDRGVRVVKPPRDLLAALRKDAAAFACWKRWSYTRQRETVEALTSAKKPETRARRLASALATLRSR
jgi:hypothetical protein